MSHFHIFCLFFASTLIPKKMAFFSLLLHLSHSYLSLFMVHLVSPLNLRLLEEFFLGFCSSICLTMSYLISLFFFASASLIFFNIKSLCCYFHPFIFSPPPSVWGSHFLVVRELALWRSEGCQFDSKIQQVMTEVPFKQGTRTLTAPPGHLTCVHCCPLLCVFSNVCKRVVHCTDLVKCV